MSPFVSCIMPTADRPEFVIMAIEQFQAQTYQDRELVILDDGRESVETLIPDDKRIRYLRLPINMPNGRKRNILCSAAAGEIIAHWDDDDLYHPSRIDYQVHRLIHSGANVNGLNQLYFYEPSTGQPYRYEWPQERGIWLHGATLCYLKRHWEENHFPEIYVCEDLAFIYRSMACEIAPQSLDWSDWYVGIIHETNVSYKRTDGLRWRKISRLPSWAERELK